MSTAADDISKSIPEVVNGFLVGTADKLQTKD